MFNAMENLYWNVSAGSVELQLIALVFMLVLLLIAYFAISYAIEKLCDHMGLYADDYDKVDVTITLCFMIFALFLVVLFLNAIWSNV